MAVVKLTKGIWVRPEVVDSIVATGPSEEFGRSIKPRVRLKSRESDVSWDFDTYEKAVEFADWLGAALDNLSESGT